MNREKRFKDNKYHRNPNSTNKKHCLSKR